MNPAGIVIVDLDETAGEATLEIARASDPERGVVVVAVSRDPARAAAALAAGATDFALIPRDRDWLLDQIARDRRPGTLVVEIPPAGLSFEEYEKRVVEHALARAGWNRTRAARELGISRPRLLRKIARYGLAPRLRG